MNDLSKVTSTADLKNIQRVFFELISRPLKPMHRMRQSKLCEQLIEPSNTLSSHERLELYAQQYWWRLLDSLRDDFPKLLQYLGERDFDALLVRYLTKHPSRSYTLRELGRELPKFLKRDSAVPQKKRSAAADIAALEIAEFDAFDSLELPALTPEALGQGPDRVRVTLQPFVRCVKISHTVDTLFEESLEVPFRTEASNTRRKASKTTARSRKAGSIRPRAITVAMYRKNSRIHHCRIGAIEARLLGALSRGGTLSQIVRRMNRLSSKSIPPKTMQEIFARFAYRGWVAVDKPRKTE